MFDPAPTWKAARLQQATAGPPRSRCSGRRGSASGAGTPSGGELPVEDRLSLDAEGPAEARLIDYH